MPAVDIPHLKSLIANLEKDLQLLKDAVNELEQQQQEKKKKKNTERALQTSAHRNAQRWCQEHCVES